MRQGAAREIGTCFVALSGLLVCGAWGGLLTRVCLAAGEWRMLRWYQGWLPMCSNLVLDALLVSRFGVAGLAAVTSLNALIGLPLLERALLRRGVLRSSTLPGLARNALAGALVAVALRQLPAPTDGPALVGFLAASASVGILGYAALVATGMWLGGSGRPWRSADGV